MSAIGKVFGSIMAKKLKEWDECEEIIGDEQNGNSDYEDYANRIRKTLYYGRLPSTHRPSLPVTGVLVDKFGKFCKQDGFDQLNLHEASSICYDACVTPCSVIVALLYLDRLRTQNPDYLASTSPSQVYIVALMVASKYLYDDGEEDEVFNDEWATSGAMLLSDLNDAEKNFLAAIDWNLFVDVKAFMEGLLYLESTVAREQGTQRGFFVYSDLLTLSKCLPPVWTHFINWVSSAFIICVVSYTAVVCIVVASTLASREYTLHIARRIHPTSLPSPQITSQLNSSICCASPLEYCDPGLPSSAWTKEEMVNEFCAKKVKSESSTAADPVGATSFSSRFSALRTLTTALLLASSSKFLDAPQQRLSQFSVSSGALEFGQTWLHSITDVKVIAKNCSLPYGPSSFELPDHSQSSLPLPRSRKGARRWRKPQNSIKEPENNSVNNKFCICSTPYLPICRKRCDDNDLDHEGTNFHTYLEYSYMVMNAIEAFLHPRLTFTSISESSSLLEPETTLFNISHLARSEAPFLSSLWTTRNYYSLELSHLNKPAFFLPWIWDFFQPFSPHTIDSNSEEVDWTASAGNLAMVT